jgi:hypothetical protein
MIFTETPGGSLCGCRFGNCLKVALMRMDRFFRPPRDQYREKVQMEVFFGGGATTATLVPRPAAPRTRQNATGDTLVSDGALRVILLK